MKHATKSSIARYVASMLAEAEHAGQALIRRKRTVLAGLVALAPIAIPIAVAMLSKGAFAPRPGEVFVRLAESLYLDTFAPLFALFFACMMIGEEVESQTIVFALTRPAPRSAWALGKYAAYMVVSAAGLSAALGLTYAACVACESVAFTAESVTLLAHYCLLIVGSLGAYGALCLFLGAATKRPVILGVALIFGWERLAMIVPGVVDFMTIRKFVNALLPTLATERTRPVVRTALVAYEKQEILIGAVKAGLVLFAVTAIFLVFTSLILRYREFSISRALGGH